jgi:hypothetical protein
MGIRFGSPKRRSENTIPERGRDTKISSRKFVMVEVMSEQGSRKEGGMVMDAIMHE